MDDVLMEKNNFLFMSILRTRVLIKHYSARRTSNMLLDYELNPKILDFGLAKLYDDKQTHMSTRVAGTIGYLAPEYAMRGHLTKKDDVFGFGVVALKIISGRPNSDSSLDDDKIYPLEWAWNLHEANNQLELVDKELSEFGENEVRRVMKVALLCTQTSPMQRPSMSRVIAMLSGTSTSHSVVTLTDDSRSILHDINGEVKGALYLFDEMPDRNETTWNTVISVLSRVGFYSDAFVLFGRMRNQGFEMSGFVIVVVE
ncbi:leucine-rich repeat transmembrane protein kinase [Tanacetum coccineum]